MKRKARPILNRNKTHTFEEKAKAPGGDELDCNATETAASGERKRRGRAVRGRWHQAPSAMGLLPPTPCRPSALESSPEGVAPEDRGR